MPIVVGISLRTAGKIYFFDPGTDRFSLGERVLVETARGPEMGTVKLPPHDVSEDQIVPPLKRVLCRATAADITRDSLNREREAQAIDACKRHIERLNLPMRLIDAQYNFDGSHVLIHFLAENRVDFRELVRDLARELHTRIELRQVGVRDEAKLLGGLGVCGRPLCCSTFLSNFTPVAINMAKVQGLALNPQKISGVCGRLMCCLAFEYEFYKENRAYLPKINATVTTPQGVGKVTKLNVIAHQVEVSIPDTPAPVWFSVDEIAPARPEGAGCCAQDGQGATCGGCCASAHASEAEHETGEEDTVPPATPVVPPAPPAEPEEDSAAADAPRRPRRRRNKRPGPRPEAATGDAPATPPSPARREQRRREGPRPPATPPDENAPRTVQGRQIPPGRYRPRRRPPRGPQENS